jgi:dTDP-D-glucose 4,6-dehydratase
VKSKCRHYFTPFDLLDELGHALTQPYAAQISYVENEPGHDRYAIDCSSSELGWMPADVC